MTLDEFLREEAKAEGRSRFRCLSITSEAMQKVQAYARLVVKHMEGVECMGFLLADADDTRGLVVDAVLAHDQSATPSSVSTEGAGVIATGEEIASMGKRAIGWFHVHPGFRPYHSPTDDQGLEVLFNQVAASNFILLEAEDVLFGPEASMTTQGSTLNIASPDMALELSFKTGDLPQLPPEITSVKLRAREHLRYAYSLVVTNASQETYAEILVQKWSPQSLRREMKNYEVKLNVLCEDEEELVQEIKKKVRPSRSFWWSGRDTYTDDYSGETQSYRSKKHEKFRGPFWS